MPKVVDHVKRKKDMLEAGLKVFNSDKRFSISSTMEEVGIPRTEFYCYFENKADFLKELEREIERLSNLAERAKYMLKNREISDKTYENIFKTIIRDSLAESEDVNPEELSMLDYADNEIIKIKEAINILESKKQKDMYESDISLNKALLEQMKEVRTVAMQHEISGEKMLMLNAGDTKYLLVFETIISEDIKDYINDTIGKISLEDKFASCEEVFERSMNKLHESLKFNVVPFNDMWQL